MVFQQSRFWSGRWIFPEKIELKERSINIHRKRFLGLKSEDESIDYAKIASVRTSKNFFTGRIGIETTGGAKEDLIIDKVKKGDIKKLAEEIEKRSDNL